FRLGGPAEADPRSRCMPMFDLARRATPMALALAAVAAPVLAARSTSTREKPMSLTLTSPSFKPNGEMPKLFTADGKDVSPPLAWSGLPAGTRSLALLLDDPDAPDPAAPKMVWVHWVVYDIPPSATSLPQSADAETLPAGAHQGRNDWKQVGWRGPAPPIGRHRYVFTLYALDTVLPDLG